MPHKNLLKKDRYDTYGSALAKSKEGMKLSRKEQTVFNEEAAQMGKHRKHMLRGISRRNREMMGDDVEKKLKGLGSK